jgi:putative membrane protein
VVHDRSPLRRLRGPLGREGSPPDWRFSFANERTFLAWNRTALALIAGGLAVAHLLHLKLGHAPLVLGLVLIGAGAGAGIAGFARWRRCELALWERARLPRSRLGPALLAGAIVALAVCIIVLLGIAIPRQ